MPISMPAGGGLARIEAEPAPFPARTKQATGLVDGVRTDVMSVGFADKILVTISQAGKLAHWVHVPLESTDPALADRRRTAREDGTDLLPLPHLTATTILGGGNPERDTTGQLFATQIATAVTTKNPEEKRLLVVGLGLNDAQIDSDAFIAILELVTRCV